jgi:hypothetical protein
LIFTLFEEKLFALLIMYKSPKRAAGIEPALLAWKAKVLPLNYARNIPT